MAKTSVSAFHRQEAFHFLDSLLASGFDSQRFSVINLIAAAEPLESIMHDLPSIQARLYRNHPISGDSLLVGASQTATWRVSSSCYNQPEAKT